MRKPQMAQCEIDSLDGRRTLKREAERLVDIISHSDTVISRINSQLFGSPIEGDDDPMAPDRTVEEIVHDAILQAQTNLNNLTSILNRITDDYDA